jgi:tetratricopeptide (TPR) repeat protein
VAGQDEDAQLRPRAPRKAAEPQKEVKDAGATSDAVEAEILKVNYVFNRELYDLAIPRYEKLLAEHPAYARLDRAHYPLGLAYYNLAAKLEKQEGAADQPRVERLKKAITHLKEAIKRKEFESRPEATRILGHALLLLDDFEGATKAFQWVVDKEGRPRKRFPLPSASARPRT